MTENPIAGSPAADSSMLDLGVALGQTYAFGLIAGRCSAAQAEALRRLRESKLYRCCAETWDDFCRAYLNISKREADRTIALLEEFGPAYFDVSQLTRISPETYRAIAGAVQDGSLHFNGEAIPLTPENSPRVAAAVAELRRSIPKDSPSAETRALMRELNERFRDVDLQQRIIQLEKCCAAIVTELEAISNDEALGLARSYFQVALRRMHTEFGRLALQTGLEN